MRGDFDKGIDCVTRDTERRGRSNIGEVKRMIVEWSPAVDLNVRKACRARLGHKYVLKCHIMTSAAAPPELAIARHIVIQTARSVGFFGWAYAVLELRE